ncbi:MAG: methyltransferase domain-containing protein [Actinomycetota bacterium]
MSADDQQRVDSLFDDEAAFWRDVYVEEGLYGEVFRERHERALAYVDALGLPGGTRVLDAGCGAGRLSVDLARRGLRVHAVDTAEKLVDAARETVNAAGLSDAVGVRTADVHALPFEDGTFAAVVALGLLPWVHTPARALAELARVLAPGGHVVLSCDSAAALQSWLDPRLVPATSGTKRALYRLLGRTAPPWPRTYSRRELRRLLGSAGLAPVAWDSIQFGPFSFLGRRLLGTKAELGLHAALQRRADAGRRPWRRLGMQHLVLARRS